jgi:hypothetical protein
MLGFDNKPLRDLIAIGRNKGLSIILATQNMDSYKSEYFDFYANAQYPLIMKQQSINDGVIKDLFGVSGKDFQEIKEAIAGLQKGELIIKNPTAIALGMGKKYKKIRVSVILFNNESVFKMLHEIQLNIIPFIALLRKLALPLTRPIKMSVCRIDRAIAP